MGAQRLSDSCLFAPLALRAGRALLLAIVAAGAVAPVSLAASSGARTGSGGTTGPAAADFHLGGIFVDVPVEKAAATYRYDLYDSRAPRWQDPDYTACTAASSMSMLNATLYRGSATSMTWRADASYSTQKSILAVERAHMTMVTKSAGTDPHGWRNALNYFGWGSLTAGVYQDQAYSSFDAAARATVTAIAKYHRPVGILAVSGGHSEFVTGYSVTGADPARSSSFTIGAIYLTDPLRSNNHRDLSVSLATWRSGSAWIRFGQYWQTDSPYRDPIDGRVGKSEWYGKWVIIAPTR